MESSACCQPLPACPRSLPESPHPETSCQLILINTLESANRGVYFVSEMGSELIYQHLSSIIRSPEFGNDLSISARQWKARHFCNAIEQVIIPPEYAYHGITGHWSAPFCRHSVLFLNPSSRPGACPPLVLVSSRFQRSCYSFVLQHHSRSFWNSLVSKWSSYLLCSYLLHS